MANTMTVKRTKIAHPEWCNLDDCMANQSADPTLGNALFHFKKLGEVPCGTFDEFGEPVLIEVWAEQHIDADEPSVRILIGDRDLDLVGTTADEVMGKLDLLVERARAAHEAHD